MSHKKAFGDFQTPEGLAGRVVALVARLFGDPDAVIEPTAGQGAFLQAAMDRWGPSPRYQGYEINGEYVHDARTRLASHGVEIFQRDFFAEDWQENLSRSGEERVLVIGNPPWVTNAELGQLGSQNLPQKTNSQGLRGLDARTGKSNFDIAEWMLIQLIEALPDGGALAMLCKTVTARKVLRYFWRNREGRDRSCLFRLNAKAEFDVAVDACLFFTTGRQISERTATVYGDLDMESGSTQIGYVDGDLVSDVEAFQNYKHLDGGCSAYTWRSGVKHDAAKVMEFTRDGNSLVNGFGDSVDLEADFVFPLLKSSDLGNGRVQPRKCLLVTQRRTGDDTSVIRSVAPKTWSYLERHAEVLDKRKSSIYQNRPRFSVFGVGPYSFAPWKVAISGLYKEFTFVVVPPVDDRPVMVDDTCYTIPCDTEDEALLLRELLTSKPSLEFLRALVFTDSKRPITVDVLRRISLVELARTLGRRNDFARFVERGVCPRRSERQMSLLT